MYRYLWPYPTSPPIFSSFWLSLLVYIAIEPDAKDVEGFDSFVERYKAGLAIEKAAVEALK